MSSVLDLLEVSLNQTKARIGKHYTAYLLSLINTVLFTLSCMGVRLIKGCPFYFGLLFRGSLSMLMSSWIAKQKGVLLTPSNNRDQFYIMLRSITLSINQFVLLYAVKQLEASVSLTIICLNSIYAFLLNYLIYGIKISRRNVCGLAITFLGIVSIINRNYFYSHELSYEIQNRKFYIALSLIFSQIVWAFGVLQTNKLSSQSNSLMVSINYSVFILFSGLFFLYQEDSIQFQPWQYLIMFVLVGIPSCISHNLFTLVTMTSEKIGNSSMLSYMGVVMGYAVDLYNGQHITIVAVLGSVLTGIGLFMVLYQDQ